MKTRKILREFTENMFEAPIDYGDRPERMDPSLQGKLETGEFPGAGSEAYPSVPPEGGHMKQQD